MPTEEVLARLLRLGIPARSASRFPAGSLPVYALDEQRVLKLYPPCYADEEPIESECLERLHGRVPIPTPRLELRGVEGWRYLVMSRLRGCALADVWADLAREHRLRLARQLGESMRAMHSLGAALEHAKVLPRPDWPAFVAAQRASAHERQRTRGLGEPWLERVDAFQDATRLGPYRPVLLHTEIMREHLLVEERDGDWTLSGLVDFEPSMIGDAEYELASVGVFVSSDDSSLFRAMLLAYGYEARERVGALASRARVRAAPQVQQSRVVPAPRPAAERCRDLRGPRRGLVRLLTQGAPA